MRNCLGIIIVFLVSCSEKPIVQQKLVDSLIVNFNRPPMVKAAEGDLSFWKSRMEKQPDNFTAKEKYGQAVLERFHYYGDISDLRTADSMTQCLLSLYPNEPAYLLRKAQLLLMQHRFSEADTLVGRVVAMQARRYASQMMSFDTEFELGHIDASKILLASNRNKGNFDYRFRFAKLMHYAGELDSAIVYMLRAAEVAGNPGGKQVALSNAADLYIHAGAPKEAYNLYKTCLTLNSFDFHSFTNIGWIALVHDKNTSLAKKVFQFVRQQTKSPEPLLKLSQAVELEDSNSAKAYALQFVKEVSRPAYGNMYHKYMIQAYTGILKKYPKAVAIARKELQYRQTPQTYAWLAWALACNDNLNEAGTIFRDHVSGKPLEALELYWMGKLMVMQGKKYNATQFFKAAEKNYYDLSPAVCRDLKRNLQ